MMQSFWWHITKYMYLNCSFRAQQNVWAVNICKSHSVFLFTSGVMNRLWIIQTVTAVGSKSGKFKGPVSLTFLSCEGLFSLHHVPRHCKCSSLLIYFRWVEILLYTQLTGRWSSDWVQKLIRTIIWWVTCKGCNLWRMETKSFFDSEQFLSHVTRSDGCPIFHLSVCFGKFLKRNTRKKTAEFITATLVHNWQ